MPVAIYDTQSSGIPKEHTLYYFLCIAFSTWLPSIQITEQLRKKIIETEIARLQKDKEGEING